MQSVSDLLSMTANLLWRSTGITHNKYVSENWPRPAALNNYINTQYQGRSQRQWHSHTLVQSVKVQEGCVQLAMSYKDLLGKQIKLAFAFQKNTLKLKHFNYC